MNDDLNNEGNPTPEEESDISHYIYDRLKDKKPECNCPIEDECLGSTD